MSVWLKSEAPLIQIIKLTVFMIKYTNMGQTGRQTVRMKYTTQVIYKFITTGASNPRNPLHLEMWLFSNVLSYLETFSQT